MTVLADPGCTHGRNLSSQDRANQRRPRPWRALPTGPRMFTVGETVSMTRVRLPAAPAATSVRINRPARLRWLVASLYAAIAIPRRLHAAARVVRRNGRTISAAWAVGLLPVGAVAQTGNTVIEFYNASLDHYVISALVTEISALDSGRFPGWTRAGFSFRVYPAATDGGAAAVPVCRFLIPPEHGDSHFLSASAIECAGVAANVATNPLYSGCVEETPSAHRGGADVRQIADMNEHHVTRPTPTRQTGSERR
jgi:hypothetical protein